MLFPLGQQEPSSRRVSILAVLAPFKPALSLSDFSQCHTSCALCVCTVLPTAISFPLFLCAQRHLFQCDQFPPYGWNDSGLYHWKSYCGYLLIPPFTLSVQQWNSKASSTWFKILSAAEALTILLTLTSNPLFPIF